MSDTNSSSGPGAGSGTDRMRGTAEEARHAAGDRWEQAKHGARETASSAAEQARRRAEAEAEHGKQAGAGQMHQWASALDRAADELGSDTMQGQFLRQASQGVDDVARSIEGRSVGEMVEAVAQFGRRNPMAFVGGAMVAGFALARFATATRDDDAWTGPGGAGSASTRSTAASTPTAGSAGGGSMRPTPTPGASAPKPAGGSAGPAGTTSAPGTASAPTGTGSPYPSAGPVPGRGND